MTLPYRVRFAALPTALRAVRRRVRAVLDANDVTESDCEMALLVLDELVSNAIEHGGGYRRGDKPLIARFSVDGADLVLEFEDTEMPAADVRQLAAALLNDDGPRLPDIDDERGRGLFLVATGLQRLQVEAGNGGSGLVLRGRLVGAAPA